MTALTLDLARALKADRGQDRRWWILAVLAIAQLMIVVDATIVNIALPPPSKRSTSPRRIASG